MRGTAGIVEDSAIHADALDLIHVYRSSDDGETWWTYYSECAGTFGSSVTTQAFYLSEGRIDVRDSYCLSGEYVVVIEPAAQRFTGEMLSSGTTEVPIPALRIAALPPFAVYFSVDGSTWYSNDQLCSGGPEVAVRDGAFELRRSYCNDANHYQVVLGAPPVVHEEAVETEGVLGVTSAFFDPAAPPSLDVLWSSDGERWSPIYAYCSGGPTFILESGRVRTPGNYCTGAANRVLVTAR